jgi:hypothetical protein
MVPGQGGRYGRADAIGDCRGPTAGVRRRH